MPPKIIVVSPSAEVSTIARELAPAGFETLVVEAGHGSIGDALSSASYFVCYPNIPMGPEFYAKAGALRLVQLLSAGYDKVDLAAAKQARIPVCNNGGANAISVAEHAMLLMLGVARRVTHQHTN
ncbi:MAG TPA: hypothetical protein VMX97_02140, partial [Hyphomicrobiaceae bacterium]|nr:hypothetical protein [Hyphomicrobiaceae bacterium]